MLCDLKSQIKYPDAKTDMEALSDEYVEEYYKAIGD